MATDSKLFLVWYQMLMQFLPRFAFLFCYGIDASPYDMIALACLNGSPGNWQHDYWCGSHVHNVKIDEKVTLLSPKNPTPVETFYLSNIDQTVAFPVETIFFYDAPPARGAPAFEIIERVKRSLSEVLLIPYYFMSGRLNFNLQTKRLELVCNNAGVLFAGASSNCTLKDLGNLSMPNPSFQHLVLRTDSFKSLADTPIFTVQVTRFKCGGFSIGFVTNHSILDGISATQMFENLASICRGDGLKKFELYIDRSCIKARSPPNIPFPHPEYVKLEETKSLLSSFTSPIQPSGFTSLISISDDNESKSLSFSAEMIKLLKQEAGTNCSTFHAVVAHIWRARTRAVFRNPDEVSSVLFAVDIRTKMSPPLPDGFIGNAVITASASAMVADLRKKPFAYAVELVKTAIDRVTDEYVRSVIDWLDVYKGVPSALNGNFYVSAWWKLPFHKLDFGCGKPVFGGPVISGMGEFVLLLSDGNADREGGAINIWITLEKEKMEKFLLFVFEI